MHNVNQVTYYIEIYFKGFLWTLMVHYISLMNSMRMIDCAPALSVAETESMSDRRLSMLNALKKYCSKSEQDTIDNLLNIFSVLDNREIYDKAGIFK